MIFIKCASMYIFTKSFRYTDLYLYYDYNYFQILNIKQKLDFFLIEKEKLNYSTNHNLI